MPNSSLTSQATVQKLRQFYDQEFKRTIIKDEDRAYRWMAQKLFRPYINGEAVLDVGCGGGFFLKEIRNITPFAIGIDLSGEALQIASKENPKSSLIQGSAEQLPFANGSFDVVFCLGSLEHFSDIASALREMCRLIRSNGWIFLMVPNLFWYKDVISVLRTGEISPRNQTYEFFATPSRWKKIIEESGLVVKRKWKYNGISRYALKQWCKDILIPTNLSYHIIFACRPQESQCFR